MRNSRAHTIAVTLLTICAAGSVLAEEGRSRIGRRIEDFSLRDSYGKQRSLDDLKDSEVVVVAFLGTECPLARLCAPKLEKLYQRFAEDKVAFVGINSNLQDTITEINGYVQRHKITFPVLKDPGNRVADAFGAERTPEVFVLDQARTVRYCGRIDDQYLVGGQNRAEPSREDLAIAVSELLAGKDVTTPETEADGCHIGRVRTVEPRGAVTYSKHIAPIFNKRCVECHRDGQIAPFTLTRFEDVEGWGETIVEVIDEGRMPPWNANPKYGHFKNDARLLDDERKLIADWVGNGMPEGDPADLPEPPTFAEGWRIPEPDQVVSMPKSFDVPADGVVDYQYFVADPGFKEDRYVSAAECRPGNRAVVHHIIAYIWPPDQKRFREEGAVDGYAPGSPPTVMADGHAKLVPAGSKIVFEMHYTPNGSRQTDRSYVGLKFVEKEKVKTLVQGDMAINTWFTIPPAAAKYKVTAQRKIRRDRHLLSMTPHMHLRGKSFRFEAVYPTGQREILLDVPRYDFNWQLSYELAEPKLLPKDTQILCTAYFDNSEDNHANPDPSATVRWGDQSWEEMMIGFFDVVDADHAEVLSKSDSKLVAPVESVDPSGVWRWEHEEGGKTIQNVLRLDYDDKTVTGTYQGKADRIAIRRATITGDRLSFEFPVEAGGQAITIEFDGHISGNDIQGTVAFKVGKNSLDFPWRAARDE